jgi:hypothetical protein
VAPACFKIEQDVAMLFLRLLEEIARPWAPFDPWLFRRGRWLTGKPGENQANERQTGQKFFHIAVLDYVRLALADSFRHGNEHAVPI